MINLKRKDAVADAVKSVLTTEDSEQVVEIEVNETTGVTDYTPKSQGGTRKELLAQYAKTKDSKHAEAARKAGASQGELQTARTSKNEDVEVKQLADTNPVAYVKTKANKHGIEDPVARMQNKKLGMKEESMKSLKQFKEQFDENSIIDQMISEVLSKDASAGQWISDFVNSDNAKFAGKSKAKRKEMALAAYYAKQRNEEVELEEGALKKIGQAVKTAGKKALETLGHGSDEDMRKDLQRKMGAKPEQQHGKKSMAKYNEETTPAKSLAKESWEDMMKAVKEKNKPQPQGGSGVKKGSRYGGSKQTDKPEHDEDNEKKK